MARHNLASAAVEAAEAHVSGLAAQAAAFRARWADVAAENLGLQGELAALQQAAAVQEAQLEWARAVGGGGAAPPAALPPPPPATVPPLERGGGGGGGGGGARPPPVTTGAAEWTPA